VVRQFSGGGLSAVKIILVLVPMNRQPRHNFVYIEYFAIQFTMTANHWISIS